MQTLLWYPPRSGAEVLQFIRHRGAPADVDMLLCEIFYDLQSDILHVALVSFPCAGGFAEDGVEEERGVL